MRANILYTSIVLFLLFLALLFAISETHADVGDVWVSPYSFTQHYSVKGYYPDGEHFKKFENSHPSLGIEYQDSESKSIAAGVYRDSYGGTSVYVARHWQYGYGLGAGMGALIGKDYPNNFIPFLGPEITVRVLDTKISIAYMPNFGVKNAPSLGVLQLSIKI